MAYRTDILNLLYKILFRTYTDSRMYYIAAEKCNRLIYKNFFRKLSHQKRCFCKRIKYEIQVQEKEIQLLGGDIKTFEENGGNSLLILMYYPL